jgi:hypothetical protein
MIKLLCLILSFSLVVVGCTSEEPALEPAPVESLKKDVPKKVVGPTTKEVAVREAKCGCSIEGIGHCGNYILVEGQYVPLIHPKLGKMEFCAQKAKGVKIKVAGLMKDGKYVASDWKLSR